VICRDREVPDGWVVVGVYHNDACPGEGDNGLIIKRPGRREVTWRESPVPSGYATVRATRSESCPGEWDNAWLIERQGDESEPQS